MLELVSHDKAMSIVTTPFVFENKLHLNPYKIQKEILSFMIMNNHLSISANQLGLPFRIIVIQSEPNLVLFNPNIRYMSEDQVDLYEASPNIPKLKIKVCRPDEIRLQYQTASGGIESSTFKGLTSRLIQHHLDYLNNYSFYKRSNLYYRNRAEKLLNKLRKEKPNE